MGKLFVWRATFEKMSQPRAAHSHYEIGKFTLRKKTHVLIKHSFCILNSGTFNAIFAVTVRTETYTIFMKFYSIAVKRYKNMPITKVNETSATFHSFSQPS